MMLRVDRHDPWSKPRGEFVEEGNARWYVVQTHQHSESLAERRLLAQGYRTYLPRRKRTVRHARSIRTVTGAYFDGYLFVSLDVRRQQWLAINSTVGVRSLLMSGSAPIPVPHGVVESLMLSTDDEGILHSEKLLKVGQRIKVTSGPFADQLGTLDYLGRTGAVRVLLDIMNRSVSVRVEMQSLIPAN
jgi:transcriptional antiterminator RfaH